MKLTNLAKAVKIHDNIARLQRQIAAVEHGNITALYMSNPDAYTTETIPTARVNQKMLIAVLLEPLEAELKKEIEDYEAIDADNFYLPDNA